MSSDERGEPLPVEVQRWSETPSPNPRCKGAMPVGVARALLRRGSALSNGKAPEAPSPSRNVQ